MVKGKPGNPMLGMHKNGTGKFNDLHLRLKTIAAMVGALGVVILLHLWFPLNGLWVLGALGLVFLGAWTEWIFLFRKRPLGMIFWSGCAVIGLSLGAFFQIFFHSGLRGWMVVGMVSIFSDSLAYICGKFFQGPKLCPKISPGKTWSGFVSAFLFSPLLISFLKVAPWSVAVLLTLCAQGGDLVESWVKRKLNVKDTGTWLVGHGGVLDRTDSWMGAALGYALFLGLGWF